VQVFYTILIHLSPLPSKLGRSGQVVVLDRLYTVQYVSPIPTLENLSAISGLPLFITTAKNPVKYQENFPFFAQLENSHYLSI
jgi:hypothetical protein